MLYSVSLDTSQNLPSASFHNPIPDIVHDIIIETKQLIDKLVW